MSEVIFDNMIDAVAEQEEPTSVSDTEATEEIPTTEAVEETPAITEPEAEVTLYKIGDKEVPIEELLSSYRSAQELQTLQTELATQQEQIQNLILLARTSPDQVLAKIGVNVEEFAISFVEKLLQEQTPLTEEQKTIKQLQKEKDDMLKAQEQFKQDQLKQRQQEEANREAQAIEEGIISALTTANITKPSPRLIARMADVMMHDLTNNKPLDPKRALSIAKKGIVQDLHEYSSVSSVESLLSEMPQEMVQQLKSFFLRQLKSPIKPQDSEHHEQQSESKKQTIDDFFGKMNF